MCESGRSARAWSLDDAMVSSRPGGTVQAAAEGVEQFLVAFIPDGAGTMLDCFRGLGSGADTELGSDSASEGSGAEIVWVVNTSGSEAKCKIGCG